MSEDGGADRPADEADEIGAEGGERRGERVFVGEIELAEDEAGGGAVEEEVVPLDRGADGRGDDRFSQLRIVLGFRQGNLGGRGHAGPPNAVLRRAVSTITYYLCSSSGAYRLS